LLAVSALDLRRDCLLAGEGAGRFWGMKHSRWASLLLAAFMGLWALPVDAAYTRIDIGLQAIESAYAQATANTAEAPADAWLVESVTPLGFTDDGQHIELVSFLVPLSGMADLAPVTTRAGPYVPQKPHTRVFCIVQSPLGLAPTTLLYAEVDLETLQSFARYEPDITAAYKVYNVPGMSYHDPYKPWLEARLERAERGTAYLVGGTAVVAGGPYAWVAAKTYAQTKALPFLGVLAHQTHEAVVSCYYKAGVHFDNALMRIDSTIGAAKYKLAEKFGGKAAKSPSAYARSLQGSGAYPGVDRFRDITLRQGTIIHGGAPGQSAFYTTGSAVERAGGSASRLFQGTQVSPHPSLGYRPGVTAYEVIKDAPAAFGRSLANPQYGAGRLPQIVVPEYENVLRPLYSTPLSP
jgi:hypothetical protein